MVKQKSILKANLISSIPLLIVLILSFSLLIFVGMGEANRVYPHFHVEKITAMGEIMQNAINTFLNAGLPLKQYVGFSERSKPLVESEISIECMQVTDKKDVLVSPNFIYYRDKRQSTESDFKSTPFTQSQLDFTDQQILIEENDKFYKIIFPLRNKFETVGFLNIYSLKSIVLQAINNSFLLIWIIAGGLILLFALLLVFLFRRASRRTKLGIQFTYTFCFLTLAGFIIFVLISLYSTGIQDKTQAMAKSLSQRLDTALDLGLSLDDFSGIDDIFNDYRTINPDISYIRLTDKGKILIHTNTQKIGQNKTANPEQFEYDIPVKSTEEQTTKLAVGVGIPRDIILMQLLRSGKNFIVLFVATAFISFLFLNLLMSRRSREKDKPESKEQKLEVIRPLYFMCVFLEGLFVSFLPQFFRQIAVAANLEAQNASWLFTIYFAAFVISLLPAGRIAQNRGTRGLIISGAFCFAISYFLLAFAGSISFLSPFSIIIISRVLSGLGQGILFIGIQSYILKGAAKGKKTQATSIIVIGYNGGMISGTAIGALLVTYIGFEGVFLIAGAVGIALLLYAIIMVKEIKQETVTEIDKPSQKTGLLKTLGYVLKDFNFIKAMLLVGIITKAVLTGVKGFALPLLLSNMNFLQEDIGQIIMFYSGAVLLSALYVSRTREKMGKTSKFLFIGTQIGGIGLYIIGFMGWEVLSKIPIPFLSTIILIGGLVILGLAHGFIHAPIVTYVAETKTANKAGISSTTSLYRFLERIGHVSGPIIVGQLLYGMGQSAMAISWIGLVVLVCGILFSILKFKGGKG